MSVARGWVRRVLWDDSAIELRQGRWGFWWTLLATVVATCMVALVAFGWNPALEKIENAGFGDPDTWWQAMQPKAWVFLGNPLTLHGFIFVGVAMIPPVLIAALVQGHRKWDFVVLHGAFSWGRFWRSGGALIATMLPFLPLSILIYGNEVEWSFASFRFPLFVCATIAVIAIQTFAEEALFRGYLYHAWLRVIPSPALVSIFWSAVFSALHWSNPDIERDPIIGMIGLMGFALFAQWLTVRTGNLDAAWGLHFATNVFLTFGLNARPGYQSDAAVLQYTDKVYAAGGSYALDPVFYASFALGYALQFVAVLHPRSPFYIAPRAAD